MLLTFESVRSRVGLAGTSAVVLDVVVSARCSTLVFGSIEEVCFILIHTVSTIKSSTKRAIQVCQKFHVKRQVSAIENKIGACDTYGHHRHPALEIKLTHSIKITSRKYGFEQCWRRDTFFLFLSFFSTI